jgi:2-C-methyl-D-erythritol 2,4-cyclodiphosphate synthase
VSVRFEPAARRAIDRAMTEVERRGHTTLDTLHLLLGVLAQDEGEAAAALRALDVSPDALRFAASREVRSQPVADAAGVEVAAATERILERAHRISAQSSAAAVSDLDILLACAQEVESAAGALLDEAGVTAPRLWAVYGSVRGPGGPAADGARTANDGAGHTGSRPGQPARPASNGGSEPSGAMLLVRSGIGYDSHRFVEGGPLTLGGVAIPADVRLVGHSDGDAVAHAVTDAVLGAAGAGDIGELFSDQDPANRGRDSIEMLVAAVERVRARGLAVHQVDVVVVAEQPRIAPHRQAMRETLARALAVPAEAVSVKGKTNEGMGWVGRGEGLACIAVATLVPSLRAR